MVCSNDECCTRTTHASHTLRAAEIPYPAMRAGNCQPNLGSNRARLACQECVGKCSAGISRAADVLVPHCCAKACASCACSACARCSAQAASSACRARALHRSARGTPGDARAAFAAPLERASERCRTNARALLRAALADGLAMILPRVPAKTWLASSAAWLNLSTADSLACGKHMRVSVCDVVIT